MNMASGTGAPGNPYVLPVGNVQISLSGGRTSGYMLHEILAANEGLPDRAEVIFANTGREMPETLDFVREIGLRWRVPITWLEYRPGLPGYVETGWQGASRAGEPFDMLIDAKSYLPNQQTRFCTSELKIRPAKRYLIERGWQTWTAALGIRADEPARLNEEPLKERWQRWYPLAAAGVTKLHVMRFWQSQPFDLRLPNIKGRCPLGNCDGCFLKSEANRAALVRDYPDRAAWWAAAEKRVSSTFSKRGSWRDLIGFVGRQGDWLWTEEAEATGALCQADGGDCTG